MLKLYGITQSRAFRPLWVLHELGLPFEHIKVDFHGRRNRRIPATFAQSQRPYPDIGRR